MDYNTLNIILALGAVIAVSIYIHSIPFNGINRLSPPPSAMHQPTTDAYSAEVIRLKKLIDIIESENKAMYTALFFIRDGDNSPRTIGHVKSVIMKVREIREQRGLV